MRSKRRLSDPLEFVPQPGADEWIRSYTIELLTPMVGGGVESWQTDKAQPIRTSEIKQQLRFWWRTMQDPATPAVDLLKMESAIFGDTNCASPVKLHVSTGQTEFDVIEVNGFGTNWDGYPGYVLFPLTMQKDEKKHPITEFTLLKTCHFTLFVSCPDNVAREGRIEDVITLWLLLGGIGARTRRGAGSLYCPQVHDAIDGAEAVVALLRQSRWGGESPAEPPAFPSLSGGKLSMTPVSPGVSAVKAWDDFLGNHGSICQHESPGYGDVRQAVGLARPVGNRSVDTNKGKKWLPGRSRWPEADTLRRTLGKNAVNHAPRPYLKNGYPRAAFGLPIQFEFDKQSKKEGDPDGKYHVVPKGQGEEGRWPSPLILKVVCLGKTLFKLAVCLNQRMPEVELLEDKTPREILANAQPSSHAVTILPTGFPIPSGDPHDGLLKTLFPECPIHEL